MKEYIPFSMYMHFYTHIQLIIPFLGNGATHTG